MINLDRDGSGTGAPERGQPGACLGRATLFQAADCASGYQVVEGYEVVRASHWRERFKPREMQQQRE